MFIIAATSHAPRIPGLFFLALRPGGQIGIEIGDNFSIMMTGTTNNVAEGTIHPELFAVKV